MGKEKEENMAPEKKEKARQGKLTHKTQGLRENVNETTKNERELVN